VNTMGIKTFVSIPIPRYKPVRMSMEEAEELYEALRKLFDKDYKQKNLKELRK